MWLTGFDVAARMVERLTTGGRTALDGDKASAMYGAERVVQGRSRDGRYDPCIGRKGWFREG